MLCIWYEIVPTIQYGYLLVVSLYVHSIINMVNVSTTVHIVSDC